MPLQNGQQLDIEHQHAVWRDAANTLSAVGKFARNIKSPLASGRHELKRFGPACNHAADRKFGRLPALVGTVENGAVNQRAVIMGPYMIVDAGFGTVAYRQHLVLQA